MSQLRSLRASLKLSQSQFAALLGVSVESYRTWDSGRRATPPAVLVRAQELANARPDRPMPLHELARVLCVHVRTLRGAARDGQLAVTYERRTFFEKRIARATLAAGEAFKRRYYRQTTRWRSSPHASARLAGVPDDYDSRLIGLRLRLGLTQAQLAAKVEAAGKAVVYQWESRKRKPSPLFWSKLQELEAQRKAPTRGHGRP